MQEATSHQPQELLHAFPIHHITLSPLTKCRDVRGGLLFRGAGRGEGENPQGGAKKRANQPIQKFYKSAKNIIWHIIISIII